MGRGASGGRARVKGHSQRSGTGQGITGRFGTVRGTVPGVRDGLGVPRGGLGLVGGPFEWFGTGRGALG